MTSPTPSTTSSTAPVITPVTTPARLRHRLGVHAVSGAFVVLALSAGAAVGAWTNHHGAQAATVPARAESTAVMNSEPKTACTLICSGSGGVGTVGDAPTREGSAGH